MMIVFYYKNKLLNIINLNSLRSTGTVLFALWGLSRTHINFRFKRNKHTVIFCYLWVKYLIIVLVKVMKLRAHPCV